MPGQRAKPAICTKLVNDDEKDVFRIAHRGEPVFASVREMRPNSVAGNMVFQADLAYYGVCMGGAHPVKRARYECDAHMRAMVPATKFYLAGAMTLLCAVLIGYGTLTPPSQGGQGLPLNDKQLHFIAFALFVLPLCWFRPKYAIWLVPLAIGYGGLIELLQPLVGRSADWADLMADAGGALTGALLAKGVRWLRPVHN